MKIIFSLICMSILLISATINEQIHALEDASPKERVALMNHIKEQLIEMNHEERMHTIASLQEKLHVKNEQKNLDNVQNISESEASHNEADDVRNLEHHEIQEQMRLSHKIEEELHQHQHQNPIERQNETTISHEAGK